MQYWLHSAKPVAHSSSSEKKKKNSCDMLQPILNVARPLSWQQKLEGVSGNLPRGLT